MDDPITTLLASVRWPAVVAMAVRRRSTCTATVLRPSELDLGNGYTRSGTPLATALAHEGKPLPAVTAQLGHSSTAVTDRYLAKIAPADLVAQIRDRRRLD